MARSIWIHSWFAGASLDDLCVRFRAWFFDPAPLSLLKAGYDAVIHISEESLNAATAGPWGMVSRNIVLVFGTNLDIPKVCAIAIAGVLGWGKLYITVHSLNISGRLQSLTSCWHFAWDRTFPTSWAVLSTNQWPGYF